MFSIFRYILLLIFVSSTTFGQEGVEKALRKLRDSVDRFEANFHRAIDDYGKAGTIRTALDEHANSHYFRLVDHGSLDFPKAVLQTERRLQKFFDSKIVAIQKLTLAAERSAAQIRINEQQKPILVDNECLQHLRNLNRSSVKNPNIWGRGLPKSGVHIAIESYKCSGPIAKDFNWTGRSQLEIQMAENARQDPTILRQYIGTYNGLTRTFPGFHWDIGSEQFNVDLFDPRFRPWFVAAETAPRDVLFLLDFSGSAKGQNAHLIKTAVMAVLQTLNPNDYIGGIWYNSRQQRVLANCTEPEDGFIQATSRNKLLFRRFLDRVEERDQASLPVALEMAFGQFLRQQNISTVEGENNNGHFTDMPKRSGGHRLVLLFTDGSEFWPTEVVHKFQQEYPTEPIRVFGFSIGYGRGPQDALAWLTCQTQAGLGQTVIGSVSEVRLKAREYLVKLSELLALNYRDKAANPANRPITWPNPYMDVQRSGPVLSLSMPILGPQPKIYQDSLIRELAMEGRIHVKMDGFVGVAGLDIGFAELGRALALEGEPDPEQAYAFILDNNGLVYYHPRLQTPPSETFAVRRTLCHRLSTFLRTNTRIPFSRADELILQQMGFLDSISQLDILQIEGAEMDELWRRFRKNMVLGRCGEILEDERRQLRCFPIRGTPLVAGFVLRKGRPRIVLREEGREEWDEDPFELAERLRTKLFDGLDGIELEENGTKSKTFSSSVGLLLRDDQLQHWELSSELSRTKPFDRLAKMLQMLPRTNPQFLAHLSAIEPDLLFPLWANKWPKEEAASKCASTSSATRQNSPFVASFLELRSTALVGRLSLLAIFPKCELPSIKSFFRTSSSHEETAKLTVNVDTNKDGGLLTVEQSIGILEGKKSLARIGVQLRGHYLQQKLQRALQQSTVDGWSECVGQGRKCLLLNVDSFVLANSLGQSSSQKTPFRPIHLSQLEPELFMELRARGLIKKISWRDPTGLCPMVMEIRQRQSHYPAMYYMQPHQMPGADQSTASSAQSMPSTIGHLVGMLISWAQFLMPVPLVFASSSMSNSASDLIIPLEEAAECEIEPQPELVEHCTLERIRFQLKARPKERKGGGNGGDSKIATALWLREKSCNRTVGLLPFGHSNLFLLLLDGPQCQLADSSPSPFLPHSQVPNCNLTLESLTLERRARSDLDYSRFHPKEFNPICTNTAASSFPLWPSFLIQKISLLLLTLVLFPSMHIPYLYIISHF